MIGYDVALSSSVLTLTSVFLKNLSIVLPFVEGVLFFLGGIMLKWDDSLLRLIERYLTDHMRQSFLTAWSLLT